jgi:predicted XRE-type DNA-binding protein
VGSTEKVVALFDWHRHPKRVLDRSELLARLNAKIDAKQVRNRDVARVLDLPSSRIPELLRGERKLYYDEGAKLIEAFELEPSPLGPLPPSTVRLVVRYLAEELGVPLREDDPHLSEIVADLQAFARFVANPQVRESIEAAEHFFRAMKVRRQEPASAE